VRLSIVALLFSLSRCLYFSISFFPSHCSTVLFRLLLKCRLLCIYNSHYYSYYSPNSFRIRFTSSTAWACRSSRSSSSLRGSSSSLPSSNSPESCLFTLGFGILAANSSAYSSGSEEGKWRISEEVDSDNKEGREGSKAECWLQNRRCFNYT